MSFEVRTIAAFEKSFKKLLRKYPYLKTDFQEMIVSLEEDPLMGTALGNDFYKIRIKITSKGKGKSGGGRVITCVKIVQETVYLAAIYDKSEKQTLSDAELKLLAKQIG
jgi:hypothetical protein